ncbi:MAG: insulinase family protein [Bdellovibrio sp.]|nr:insulinase family protein [Bdellovibrio sp.]
MKVHSVIILKVIVCLWAIALWGCSHQAKSPASPVTQTSQSSQNSYELPKLTVHKKILNNGLVVLVHENHLLPIMSYYTFFDVGGRYESRDDGTTGATHFLEHMMFKGAKKYGPGLFDSKLEALGGSTNAYTTFDDTVYHQELPSSGLELIMDMEADRMGHLLLEEEAFEKERAVIFEERKMRYENSPHGKLLLAMMQEVFKETPYGGSVIGDETDLKNLTRPQVQAFFKRFYAPNNAIIVIVGDVDHEKVFALAEQKFGSLQANNVLAVWKKNKDTAASYLGDSKVFGRTIRKKGNNPTPLFYFAYKGEPLGTRRAFVMDILAAMLGTGSSSYLNQKYVKGQKPTLNSIYVGNYNLKYSGVFYINGELLHKRHLQRFEREFQNDLRHICSKAITERALQKAKNQFMVSYFNQLAGNDELASFLGMRESAFGDYNYYVKELEIYHSITREEVLNVCSEVMEKSKYVYLSMVDGDGKN